MPEKIIISLFCVVAALCAAQSLPAQGTAFTYQGQLNDGGSPAGGSYDLTFTLYSSTNLASPAVAGTVTNTAVAVANGMFTTTLDFGAGIFTGTNFWLQIAVRTNGAANFTTLAPRQPLTPVPYAIFANTASNLSGSLPATQLNGTLPSAQIGGMYISAVTFSNSANYFTGTFIGDGSSLSNLNAARLTSGALADVRLSTNVPLLNANQTFSGANTFNGANSFTNMGNSFHGSFFGNGLVGWLPQAGASVSAVSDTGYLLNSAQLTTVTLPTLPAVGDIVRISGAGAGGWKIAQNSGQSILGSFLSYANAFWTSVQSANNWDSIACSADGSRLVAVNDATGAYTSQNFGATWSSPSVPPSSGRGVASSADGKKLVVVVYGGGIYTSINSGASWQNTGPGNANWYAVASSADGTKIIAAVYGGDLYYSANSGGSWTPEVGAANWVSVASSADGTRLLAAISGGGMYLSANSGTSWQTTGSGNANWTGVASSADGSKLAAANSSGYIYTSLNSGATWAQSGSAAGFILPRIPGRRGHNRPARATKTGSASPHRRMAPGWQRWFAAVRPAGFIPHKRRRNQRPRRAQPVQSPAARGRRLNYNTSATTSSCPSVRREPSGRIKL
jgi:hypothetical protein